MHKPVSALAILLTGTHCGPTRPRSRVARRHAVGDRFGTGAACVERRGRSRRCAARSRAPRGEGGGLARRDRLAPGDERRGDCRWSAARCAGRAGTASGTGACWGAVESRDLDDRDHHCPARAHPADRRAWISVFEDTGRDFPDSSKRKITPGVVDGCPRVFCAGGALSTPSPHRTPLSILDVPFHFTVGSALRRSRCGHDPALLG